MIPSVSSFKMHGKDSYYHVISMVESGLEVWSRIVFLEYISEIGREPS